MYMTPVESNLDPRRRGSSSVWSDCSRFVKMNTSKQKINIQRGAIHEMPTLGLGLFIVIKRTRD